MHRRYAVAVAVVLLALATAVFVWAASRDGGNDTVRPVVAAPVWMEITTQGPPIRSGHATAIDEKRDTLLSFAGSGELLYNDLWSLSLGDRTWRRIETNEGPTPRGQPTMIVDGKRDRAIVFGGSDGRAIWDDVWALDLTTNLWAPLPKGPPSRFDHMVDVDHDRGRMYIFGGFGTGNRALDDLWELDLTNDTWREIQRVGAGPAPRTNSMFAVIDHGARLLVFGGHDERNVNADSWVFDLDRRQWSKLTEVGRRGARAHMAVANDLKCNRVWMFGGDSNDTNDLAITSTASLEGQSLVLVDQSGAGPVARRHAAMVIDPKRRQLIVTQGQAGSSVWFADVWAATLPAEC